MTALFMSMAWVPVAIPVVHQVGLCGVQKVLLMSTGSSMSSGGIVDILNKSVLFCSIFFETMYHASMLYMLSTYLATLLYTTLLN